MFFIYCFIGGGVFFFIVIFLASMIVHNMQCWRAKQLCDRSHQLQYKSSYVYVPSLIMVSQGRFVREEMRKQSGLCQLTSEVFWRQGFYPGSTHVTFECLIY